MTSTLGSDKLRVNVSFLGTRVNVVHESHCPEIGPICAERDEPPHLHDQVLYVAELRGIFEYGFSDRWALEVQVPLKLVDTRVEYRQLDGTAFLPDYEMIHHANETLAGAGDPWISARWGTELGRGTLSARAGLSIPLGGTVDDPFALGDAGKKHQHIQFGTGTFNPVFGADVSHPFGPVEVRAYGQAQLTFYENARGYRAGNRYGAGVLGGIDVIERLRISAGLDVVNEQPERWRGEIKQDGNLGRTDLLVGVSGTVTIGGTGFTLGVKVPVYQDIITSPEEPGQLTYPLLVTFAISTSLVL